MVALGSPLGSGIQELGLHPRDVIRVDFVAVHSGGVELEVAVAIIVRILNLLSRD